MAAKANSEAALGLTHFLRWPISNVSSRTQLGLSCQKFLSDPLTVSSGMPKEALLSQSRLHIHIGRLSLQSHAQIKKAIYHLQKFDLRTMLRQSMTQRHSQDTDVAAPKTPTDIRVNIRGLRNMSGYTDITQSQRLPALVVDDLGLLPMFRHLIIKELAVAGLMKFSPFDN